MRVEKIHSDVTYDLLLAEEAKSESLQSVGVGKGARLQMSHFGCSRVV